MAFDEYNSIDAVNFSTLKFMAESPLHYIAAKRTPRKETPALYLGTATHCAVLEPGMFEEEYVVEPEFGDCRNPRNKAERDNWRAINEGKKRLSADDFERLTAMSTCVRSHPAASKLLAEGKAETTLTWTDSETGLACKGRLDWLMPDGTIVGLKTTRSNNFRDFQRSVETYGYLLQWSFYQTGYILSHPKAKPPRVIEICVESNAPHDVVVYEVPQDLLDQGFDELRPLLKRVAECRETGHYPGRSEALVSFERAPWAGKAQQDTINVEGLDDAEEVEL